MSAIHAPSARFFVSPTAAVRLAAADAWLDGHAPSGEVTVVGETLAGTRDVVLRAARRARGAMGRRRTTLPRLAGELALLPLAARGRVVGDTGARDAIVARTLLRLDPGDLGRLARVSDTPGFIGAMGGALEELRMAGIAPEAVAAIDPALAGFARAVASEWAAAGLTDRAGAFEAATERLGDAHAEPAGVGCPLLLLDVRIWTEREARFVEALLRRSPDTLATVPRGDERTIKALRRAGAEALDASRTPAAAAGVIGRLHAHLFASAPDPHEPDDAVTVFSAPGEGREAVEIARRLLALAEAGTPFDRCAILLRQPEDYRPYVEEALRRAGIPAWFAAGVRRPDAAGRAFLALLRCRAEGDSALRFAEYVSIGEVPLAPEGETARRVPRRWEKLLVDASVVGGRDRWERRLDVLAAELERKRAALVDAADGGSRVDAITRALDDLAGLRAYALPLLAELGALPTEATWAKWLTALNALAARALRHPESVRTALVGLAPMGPVGPVDLDEVLRVLRARLVDTTIPPPADGYGRVFVGPVDAVRGLAFDVVFVPGMAERVLPPKIREDAILLDDAREALGAGGLPTNRDRVRHERLAFRLAVGAAREQVVLSYPRIEAMQARPRVPSFYALEAVHAAEGRLPGFEELAARAEDVSEARIGWPAPASRGQAIDEAEYDLAVLDRLGLRGDGAVRAAGHLLHSNPHLARALRFRAYRWEVPGWTWADGLVRLPERAAAALADQSPSARPYSVTALQNFAACPYRFYLHAIQRLREREAPVGIEALDPLERGSLVHQVQFELLTRLQAETREGRGLLPVTPDNLSCVQDVLEEVLDGVADDFRDRLVPAIDRVWRDGIEAIRLDLREWLQRESRDPSPFEPWRFELSFGLPHDPNRDAHSVLDPVELEGGLRIRGAIDLVERTAGGVLRVTDHKTGRYRAKPDAIIQGGELLQPVLYGLAVQSMFPERRVESGRLYYCTTDGEFRDHEVPLGTEANEAAQLLGDIVLGAFAAGRFPALPAAGACRWCDYKAVCGPDEERRIRRKPAPVALRRLRECP